MSGTRKAKDESVFHQAKFASSPDFERGLIANLVAKRCALVPDADARELIWFIQYLSHQAGGLAAVAKELVEKFRQRMGPRSLVALAKGAGDLLDADDVRKIRLELPPYLRTKFRLHGEIDKSAISAILSTQRQADRARLDMESDDQTYEERREAARLIKRGEQAAGEMLAVESEAQKHPATYSVESFLACCVKCAENGGECGDEALSLERELARVCLDPACGLDSGPWYFSGLVNILREFHQQWTQEKSKVVVTTLGNKVCETLDFTLGSRSLTLLEGNARLGKSFSAKAWCEQRPGKARFVEVAPGNDDASFYRDLARGLGLGNFLNYKVVQIRERVESVLLTGDILLVLDEAQRLWPQRNLRECFPGRIVWVMTMANAGVPICMVSTPQFIQAQKAAEKTGWNSAQLTGRIGHYEFLPTELDVSDLVAVGREALPEAGEQELKALALYARASARYLAAVDCVAKRAKYIAARAGRPHCTTDDIRTAMKESVIPSDTKLLQTLEQAKQSQGKRQAIAQPELETETPAPVRNTAPPAATRSGFHHRVTGPVELVEG